MKIKLFLISICLFCAGLHSKALSSNMPLFNGSDGAGTVNSLNGEWKLSYWAQAEKPVTDPSELRRLNVSTIKATVPGNVELDLLAAGIIPDPMLGNNIYELRKYEGHQWCYSRDFVTPSPGAGQKLILRFGGIDCFADIWLNGNHIGSTSNMFIEQDFDITDKVSSSGQNTLDVILRSAVMEAQNYILGPFSTGNMAADEAAYIRKAPHSYGWDIMPRVVSAGLWRNVELHTVNAARIIDVNWLIPHVDPVHNTAAIYADFQMVIPFEDLDNIEAHISISRNGKEVHHSKRVVDAHSMRQVIHLHGIELWWPKGYGEPALYDAEIKLTAKDGKVLSTDKKRIGFRRVELERNEINDLPDNPGKFCFIVNGERIFVKGTNWVPLDAFHSRDDSHLDEAIAMTADMNCNMIRCWGGNVYEDHRFFDLCDENGIMVWQDFAMGCTFYPQRDDFAKAIEEEAISVVLKLRNHPSLVLWCGNNEDDASLRWSLINYNINPNYDRVTREILHRVLYEFDPTRPYLPSSPYYSQEVYELGSKDDNLPENHIWGPRGYYKDSFYTEAKAQFVSEIGYHGCPNLESIKKMFTKDSVYPWTDVKEHEWNGEWVTKSVRILPTSGKTVGRNNLMLNQVTQLFGSVPDKLEDFISGSQIVQAEAMKYFVEKWRGDKFDRTGIVWWNIRDGWPIISDAVVDYYNSKKLAYYFLKNVQHDVCVLINDAVGGKYPLKAVNDTRIPAEGKVTVTDVKSGKEIYSGNFTIDPNGKTVIAEIPEMQGQGMLLISYETGGQKLKNHYLYGTPPYDMKEYKELLKKTKIYDLK